MGLLLEGVPWPLDRGSLMPGLPHPSVPLHSASSRYKEPPDAPEPPVLDSMEKEGLTALLPKTKDWAVWAD